MDAADIAQEQLEAEEAARRKYTPPRPPALEPNGACHNCEKPLRKGKRFCDAACAADYEWVGKRRALQ